LLSSDKTPIPERTEIIVNKKEKVRVDSSFQKKEQAENTSKNIGVERMRSVRERKLL